MRPYTEKIYVRGSSESLARNILVRWEDKNYSGKTSEVSLMLKGESWYEQSFLNKANVQRESIFDLSLS